MNYFKNIFIYFSNYTMSKTSMLFEFKIPTKIITSEFFIPYQNLKIINSYLYFYYKNYSKNMLC